MNDLDALLKQFEQPTKSNVKENVNTQQKSTKQTGGFFFDNSPPPQQQQQQPKLPLPSLSKYDSDNRKGNIPLFSNANMNSEQRRTTILKQPPKPSIDQSFDIDAILQGRAIQPQQPSKQHFHQITPTKNSALSRKDADISDWLNDDNITTKTHTQKTSSKPTIDLNPDDFFSNSNNNREQNETKPSFSTAKASAKQYYMGNSRYKPGINPRQTTRRDSFNWLLEPANNSNSTSMYFFFCFENLIYDII
jgi:hypothetical protein